MKKVLIVFTALFFCSIALQAQQNITFLGLDWGLSEKEVSLIMADRKFKSSITEYGNIEFSGNVGGSAGKIIFDYYKDQLYSAELSLETGIPIIEIVSILSEKYGVPVKYEDTLVELYTWDLGEKGKLEVSVLKIPKITRTLFYYVDQIIYKQKLRDELAGL